MMPEIASLSARQTRRLVLQYEVLRSAAEIAASDKGNNFYSNQDIICTLLDIDHVFATLPRRQQAIVFLFIGGLSSREIAGQFNLSNSIVKFYIKNAIFQINTYLNH